MPDEDKNFRGSLVLEFWNLMTSGENDVQLVDFVNNLRFHQLSYRIDEKRKNIIFCLRLHFLN